MSSVWPWIDGIHGFQRTKHRAAAGSAIVPDPLGWSEKARLRCPLLRSGNPMFPPNLAPDPRQYLFKLPRAVKIDLSSTVRDQIATNDRMVFWHLNEAWDL